MRSLNLDDFKIQLPQNQLVEVITNHKTNSSQKYLIGINVDQNHQLLKLLYHPQEVVVIPFAEFNVSGNNVNPDFIQVSIIDHGLTLKLGTYEADSQYLYETYRDEDDEADRTSLFHLFKSRVLSLFNYSGKENNDDRK